MGGLGLIFLLEAAEGGEGDGFVIVDEAFAVVVRPAGGGSSFLILFSPEIFAFYPLYKIIIFVVLDYYLYLCTHKSIKYVIPYTEISVSTKQPLVERQPCLRCLHLGDILAVAAVRIQYV